MFAVRGSGRFVQCEQFANKGEGIQMWTSALFGAKNIGFFEVNGVSVQTKGLQPVRIFFADKGRVRVNFCDFVRTSFMDNPLDNVKVEAFALGRGKFK